LENFKSKFDLDAIEVPDEFKDLDYENFVKIKKRRQRRPQVKVRQATNLQKYEFYRVYDREYTMASR
jgi:hypothetical protein